MGQLYEQQASRVQIPRTRSIASLTLAMVCLATIISSPSYAQAAPASSADLSTGALPEIIVSARKRDLTLYGKNLLDQHQKLNSVVFTGLGFIANAWYRGRVFGVNLGGQF